MSTMDRPTPDNGQEHVGRAQPPLPRWLADFPQVWTTNTEEACRLTGKEANHQADNYNGYVIGIRLYVRLISSN